MMAETALLTRAALDWMTEVPKPALREVSLGETDLLAIGELTPTCAKSDELAATRSQAAA